MTRKPVVCDANSTVTEAAEIMRDRDIGDVLVERDGRLTGIVTDRDIVVRALATGNDPRRMPLGDIVSGKVTAVKPSDSVEMALQLMRDNAVRRLPVVEDGRAIGIVSIGDLALERDEKSALSEISAAKPNN